MSAGRVLADLAPALEELGLRWYVFGAQAAIHYGSVRATADVDVTVELGETSVDALLARLAAAGIEPRVPLDAAFVAQARVLPLVHGSSRMALDVVLAGPGPEELFLSRAREVRVEGVRVLMVGPTDLVVMKTLAARPKDVEDLVAIVRAAPDGLDLDEARALVEALEQALGQSDLSPVLATAIARARR